MPASLVPDLVAAILERSDLHERLATLDEQADHEAYRLELTPLLRAFGVEGPLGYEHPVVQAVRYALLLRRTDGLRPE